MSKPIIKSEDYVSLYCELATIMFDRHIEDAYNDYAYVEDSNGNLEVKEKYEDLWCDTVDEVCDILDVHLEREE